MDKDEHIELIRAVNKTAIKEMELVIFGLRAEVAKLRRIVEIKNLTINTLRTLRRKQRDHK